MNSRPDGDKRQVEAKEIVLSNVNRCIYCHTTDGKLSQEHVVPFGLNGKHVLLNASCDSCSKITSKIEFNVLRKTFILARRELKFKSRHTKHWEKPEDIFSVLFFPITDLPAHISGNEYKSGVNVRGMTMIPLSNPSQKSSSVTFSGNDFERMLAKIALGFAIGHFGYDSFDEFYVIPGILGQVDDIGRWVGMANDNKIPPQTADYITIIEIVNREVVCRIKLFAMVYVPQVTIPEYLVVVGKLKVEVTKPFTVY